MCFVFPCLLRRLRDCSVENVSAAYLSVFRAGSRVSITPQDANKPKDKLRGAPDLSLSFPHLLWHRVVLAAARIISASSLPLPGPVPFPHPSPLLSISPLLPCSPAFSPFFCHKSAGGVVCDTSPDTLGSDWTRFDDEFERCMIPGTGGRNHFFFFFFPNLCFVMLRFCFHGCSGQAQQRRHLLHFKQKLLLALLFKLLISRKICVIEK